MNPHAWALHARAFELAQSLGPPRFSCQLHGHGGGPEPRDPLLRRPFVRGTDRIAHSAGTCSSWRSRRAIDVMFGSLVLGSRCRAPRAVHPIVTRRTASRPRLTA